MFSTLVSTTCLEGSGQKTFAELNLVTLFKINVPVYEIQLFETLMLNYRPPTETAPDLSGISFSLE